MWFLWAGARRCLGLIYVPYAEIVYFKGIDFRIALACIVGAGVVLWSTVPRPDRFEAPGPELVPAHHPEPFQGSIRCEKQLGRIHQGTLIWFLMSTLGSPSAAASWELEAGAVWASAFLSCRS